MGWSKYLPAVCKRKLSLDFQNTELQKKQLALNKKEKELHRKERALREKIKHFKKYNSHKGSNAKSDLKAAKKLKHAKKKLMFALDAKDKTSKRKHHRRKKKNEKQTWIKCRIKKKKKGLIESFTEAPVSCLTNLLTSPCTCYCTTKDRRGNFKRQAREVDPSFLRKVFGGPCGCPTKRPRPSIYRRLFGFQTCRCEFPNTRERPNYGAGGDCFLMTLRQKPQLWIYHRWPHIYPQYLSARHQWRNLRHCLLVCAAILFWMPCLLCLELCKCCFCACFSD